MKDFIILSALLRGEMERLRQVLGEQFGEELRITMSIATGEEFRLTIEHVEGWSLALPQPVVLVGNSMTEMCRALCYWAGKRKLMLSWPGQPSFFDDCWRDVMLLNLTESISQRENVAAYSANETKG